jgi:hypothetical protein
VTKYKEILDTLPGPEDRCLALVRKVPSSYVWFPLSSRRVALDSDAGKGILTRRKNEDQGGPRRSVADSGTEMPEASPLICCWKNRNKSRGRRGNQFELSGCGGLDHRTGSSLVCCISAGDLGRQISVALRGSRSSSVLKFYRGVNRHDRLRGAHAGPPSLPVQVAGRSILAPATRMGQIPRSGLGVSRIPYIPASSRKRYV